MPNFSINNVLSNSTLKQAAKEEMQLYQKVFLITAVAGVALAALGSLLTGAVIITASYEAYMLAKNIESLLSDSLTTNLQILGSAALGVFNAGTGTNFDDHPAQNLATKITEGTLFTRTFLHGEIVKFIQTYP